MKTAEERKQEVSQLLQDVKNAPAKSLLDEATKQDLQALDGVELKFGDIVLGIVDLDTAELKYTKKNLPFINLIDSGMYPSSFGRFASKYDLMQRVAININPVDRKEKK